MFTFCVVLAQSLNSIGSCDSSLWNLQKEHGTSSAFSQQFARWIKYFILLITLTPANLASSSQLTVIMTFQTAVAN